MQIRFLGHAGFQLSGSKTVIIDPFLTGNPSAPFGPEAIQSCDLLLITHDHADHESDAENVLRQTGATLVGIHEIAVKYAELGYASEGMNIGGSLALDGVTVHVVNAIHSSPASHECGFIVEMDGRTVYHMGDTGLFGDMALYARFFQIDLAMVPIGDRYTMGLRSAAEAVRMVQARRVIPMHYNTFPIIEQDPQVFGQLVGDAAEVVVLAPGESMELT